MFKRYCIQIADRGIYLSLKAGIESVHGTDLTLLELSGNKSIEKTAKKKNQAGQTDIGKKSLIADFCFFIRHTSFYNIKNDVLVSYLFKSTNR